jgi:RNA polymerase sigma-70 factor (ECF subfamily)
MPRTDEMGENTAEALRAMVGEIYRSDSRRVFATLVRLLGDFDLAEDAMHNAFAVALERWPKSGVPANPRAWIVSASRFKAIDALRRRARFEAALGELADRLDSDDGDPAMQDQGGGGVEDDRLRLIFTCCHPALQQRSKALTRMHSWTRLAAITFWQDEYCMLVQSL